jgi:hypothetical protein
MHLGRTTLGLQTYKQFKKIHITPYHKSKMQNKKKKKTKNNKIEQNMGKNG